MNTISLIKRGGGTFGLMFFTALAIVMTSSAAFAQIADNVNETSVRTAAHAPAIGPVPAFMPDERNPEFLNGVQAFQQSVEYPHDARVNGVEGTVIVRFVVNTMGNVVSPRILKGIGHGCDEAAVDALLKTRFMPALQNRRPVAAVCVIPITFRLTD